MGLTVLAEPIAARAQQPAKMAPIGFLVTASIGSPEFRATVDPFRRGLRDLGYVEGRDLIIEYRSADGNQARFPSLASDLVRLNVDLILAGSTPHARAAQRATRTIPIVVAVMGDPVADGLVASLARPGGNITGLTNLGPELTAKRMDLLRYVEGQNVVTEGRWWWWRSDGRSGRRVKRLPVGRYAQLRPGRPERRARRAPARLLAAPGRKRESLLDQAFLTFAAWRPFGPFVTSNSTRSPSARLRKPLPWTAE
jgi:hypothetical protein